MISGRDVVEVAEEYLAPVQAAGVDTLVLGCTHYPMLAGPISYVMGPDGHAGLLRRGDRAGRIRPAAGVRAAAGADRGPRHVFAQTADGAGSENFARLSRRFLGPTLDMTRSLPVVTA